MKEFLVDWWMLEIIKILALLILAVGLHRMITRFGKNYVTDILAM